MNDRNCWGFPTCCEYHGKESCDQGRDCPSRIPGVHTQDGGHQVNGGISFPIGGDEPVYTSESCQRVTAWVLFAAILAAAIAAAAAVVFRS